MIVICSSFFYFFPKRKQHGNGRFPSENASKMLNSPHFLVTKMPYSIPSNATLYHRKCHISFSEMLHFVLAEVWRFTR